MLTLVNSTVLIGFFINLYVFFIIRDNTRIEPTMAGLYVKQNNIALKNQK